ncbi:uncharacterized protein DUF4915 [Paenibacillus cellulosilyticus]|uniref:Uncharacterized protein DUF4915 n=1 Tax=Paenibacillus cellulosilyticus TaxID=375489 RepID=A0A2V2YSE3_9BACL|nr:DUF4915 domain-containing protein [Paenibacillus cellulosilyticus]PWW00786.1 uncharacterized protein DUF4915 [Paenibacillus cellulosilyticus]QKS45639.1 DUF4915 domain-containing protein [Paenibacillus cellulosilyticus]
MDKRFLNFRHMLNLKQSLIASEKEEIIVFGTGSGLDKVFSSLPLNKIKYAVDVDQKNWGTCTEQGLEIKDPSCLLHENKDRIFILITTSHYYEAYSQLTNWGFCENVDFMYALQNVPVPTGLHPEKELLVSCCGTGGGVFHINLRDDKITKLMSGDFRGISYTPHGYCVLNEASMFFLDDKFSLYREERLHDSDYDLHGVVYDDGHYYIIETATNTLTVYNEHSMTIEKRISFSKTDEDLNHINDIFVDEESIYLSMLSMKGLTKNLWTDRQDGAIVELDKETLEPKNILKENLNFPHSVKVFNGDLYYCESLNFNVMMKNKELVTYGGFTRGIEFDGKLLYIGQSTFRNAIADTVTSVSMDAGIHIFDPMHRTTRMIKLDTDNVYGIILVK